ncbi:MAG: alpha/beta hydrolase [Bacteroidota bacterium]
MKDPSRKDLKTTWKNHFTSNHRIGIVKAVRGVVFRKGISDIIDRISQPTTIMVGEKDELTDVRKAEIMHSLIKDSVVKLMPRSGHMSPVEEPDIVNSLIEDHLNRYA